MKLIRKAKNLTKRLLIGCLYLLTKKKVVKNKIFFVSYMGKQMNDNPMAIYEELIKQNEKYRFVWVYDRHRELDKKDYPNTKFVDSSKAFNLKMYYHLFTSKVIINNARFHFDIRKKESQYYIQTWHASMGLKKIEKDVENQLSKSYCDTAKRDSKYINLLLAGCRFKHEAYKTNFWYEGEISDFGTPRNDIFFADNKNEIKDKVKSDLNISPNSKIILYAPTFRNDNSKYLQSFDEARLQALLGDEWKIVVRLHPNELQKKNNDLTNRQYIDATKYNNLQELLIATDILITDYSSTMFDFFIQEKPCFLFCPDYADYVGGERDLNFDLEQLPFDMAKSMEELLINIGGFNQEKYLQKLEDFNKVVGSYENGHAAENVVKIIDEVIDGKRYIKKV